MDWQTLRNQFMRNIGGDPPGAHLEDELIQAYTDHPDAVEKSFEKIALAFKAGKIRSPWGALKAEVAKAVDAARNPTHSSAAKTSTAIQRAEQWIRNAGLMFDRWDEIHDELFGDRGMLHPQRHDQRTTDRIHTLWNELRPLGITTETAELERADHWKAHREAIENLPKPPKPTEKATT